jgi:EpsI family protein
MTKNDGPNRRPVVAAAVVASFLMLVFGLTYRVLAARLSAPVNTAPVQPAVLEQFPLQIGGWRGEEVPLDEAIVRQTGTDAHLNRRYVRGGGLECVSFYVACGVKARDLMPHRPEVCYTGAGWTLTDRRSVELPLSGSAKLPCNLMQFSRGTLNTQKVVVLDYYLVDGQYCADVSLLRSKAWRGSGTVRYVAQIQIVTPVTATFRAEAAAKAVSDFAVESAALTASLFDDPETNRSEGELHESPKGQ